MEPDIDSDMDDETEYDLFKEVPKQTNWKVYFSKDYSNVFHCWKAVNVFYYRFHAITVKFSSKYCKNTSQLVAIL